MEKNYLYHMVPKNMKGDILHPLNSLEKDHKEIYDEHVKKYENREAVMDLKVHPLECSWNDVIHLSAVPPEEIKKALEDAYEKYGFKKETLEKMSFYKIDPDLLEKENTTIFLNQNIEPGYIPEQEDFISYDSSELKNHSVFPESTKKHYQEEVSKRNRPALFVGIPHIFHKGSINISDFPVITV
jgi:hypothetical protein